MRSEQLRSALTSGAEPVRLSAAYELGMLGTPGADVLLAAMVDRATTTSVRRTAMYGGSRSKGDALREIVAEISILPWLS